MKRLEGKTVGIIAASRGIGAAIAKRFAREGASVVQSANEELVKDVSEDMQPEGQGFLK